MSYILVVVRNILYIFAVSIGVALLFFVSKNLNLKEIVSSLSQSKIYIQRDNSLSFLPDWTENDLLEKINIAREASGTSKLILNTKLNQAAKARLSVILTENDVDGSVTGLTREKALTSVGYEASLVGELILTGYFKTNDPITYWNNDSAALSTLYHKDFRDVGIAIKNSTNQVDIYILLAAPRKIVKQAVTPKITWGGPDLWTAINKRRVEMGVNPLKQMDFLCTIASIRLNQLLELGKLDGHAGFVPVLERSDLKATADKYNISEFLIQGYPTPEEAVKGWENTMGHRVLLSGGEYVWGCVYAQNGFGVAMAAY